MEPLDICLSTQTPLLQFRDGERSRPWAKEATVELADLSEGEEYTYSPGGVTRMVLPLVRRMVASGRWGEVHWFALNPNAPATVRLPEMTLHHVRVPAERLQAYGNAKEAIWTTVHGLRPPGAERDLFWSDDYGDYTFFNRATAEEILRVDRSIDFDVFYVHDFQLLPLGHMLGTVKPKVFRWHIPFDRRRIPAEWKPLVSRHLASYDLVIVSADRYRRSLQEFGHRGAVAKLYPFVDAGDYSSPGPEEVDAAVARWGIDPVDEIALVVARMDPAKGQDAAIAAIAELAEARPRLKLVLVGNGSFSSARGGVGLSKADRWRQHLEGEARRLGIAEKVVFTGHVSQSELDCLYERAKLSVLPSLHEGFGLVVVESWLHHTPVVVTERAGIADLVRHGENGLLFDPEQPGSLARRISELLADRNGLYGRLSAGGRRTAELCTLDRAAEAEDQLLGGVVEA